MGKSKYKYQKDLKIYSFLNPPVIIPALPFMQAAMKGFYYLQKRDKSLSSCELKLISPDGGKLRVILYTADNAAENNSPLIIFYHGGGFVYNAAPHHFSMAKTLCRALKAKVAFVDYRLAPKYPFPVPVEDAFCAYEYFLSYSERYGIDKNKIALCGDSAGANLSAVVSLMARNKGITPPCGQALIYPFVDASKDTDSMRRFTDTPMCNSKAAESYNKAYIPEGGYEPKEYFSVVDAPSLEGLPPTYIETAEFDCLHDGAVKFYNRLKAEGNEVELYETEGTMHGYDIATKSETVKRCTKKRIEFFERIFKA